MKHVILGLNNKDLNEQLAAQSDSIIADYTMSDISELSEIKDYFKPDALVISANLKVNNVTDQLINIKKSDNFKNCDIVLFLGEVNDSDVEMIKQIGKLIDAGIYPVLDTAKNVKQVLPFIDQAPEFTERLHKIYQAYQDLQKPKKLQVTEKPVQNKPKHTKLGRAKFIGFQSAMPAVGKKFVLSNFAMELARKEENSDVLVIDLSQSGDLNQVFSLDKDDCHLNDAIKAVREYTANIRLSNQDEKKQAELSNKLADSLLKYAIPAYGTTNLLLMLQRANFDARQLTANDLNALLTMLSDCFDVIIFNLSADFVDSKVLTKLYEKIDRVYSIVTMNRNDINANLRLNQRYHQLGIEDTAHYILNKYNDDSDVKLKFGKDLLDMYGIDYTNIIPNVNVNILNNESFMGTFLVQENSKETEFARDAFKMLVKDAGH